MRTAILLALALPTTVAAQLQRPSRSGAPVVAEGPTRTFTPIPYTPPGDPTGFTATVQGNKVLLSWQPVTGVSSYLLGGSGIGLYGQQVQATAYAVDNLAAGTHEWTVASLDADGRAINNGAKWPKASVTLTPATATTGRYRITLAGFEVLRETYDDQLNRDGYSDEVYAAASWGLFDRTSKASLANGTVRSRTYGDNRGWPARVLAGKATPSGGLMAVDTIPRGWRVQGPPPVESDPIRLPVVVWEGSLTNGREILVVRPALWEEDADPATYLRWRQKSEASGFPDYHGREQHLTGPLSGPFGGKPMFGTNDHLLHQYLGSASDPLSAGKDRPIGVDHYGNSFYWTDRYFVLTRENLESTFDPKRLAQTRQVPGLLTVWLSDQDFGTDISQRGHYRLLLGVERIP